MPSRQFSPESFAFLRELGRRPRRDPATTAWFAEHRAVYERQVAAPFNHLMACATPWLAAVDPARRFRRSSIHTLAGYKDNLWAQFGDQAGPQLFLRVTGQFVDYGFSTYVATDFQRLLFRNAIAVAPAEFWSVLEPMHESLSFEPDADDISQEVVVSTPAELVRWSEGPKPRVARYVMADDPHATTDLTDEVTRTLLAMHRFALAVWTAQEQTPEARGVFISYRRGDSALRAARLHDWLRWRLADEVDDAAIFFDTRTILPGADWRAVIHDGITSSRVTLVVIGPGWECARLAETGDVVAREVGEALVLRRRVFPVLVDGATMPAPEQLPEPLRGLAKAQAFILRDDSWDADVEVLLTAIRRALQDPPRGPAPVRATPAGRRSPTP